MVEGRVVFRSNGVWLADFLIWGGGGGAQELDKGEKNRRGVIPRKRNI